MCNSVTIRNGPKICATRLSGSGRYGSYARSSRSDEIAARLSGGYKVQDLTSWDHYPDSGDAPTI